MEQNATKVGEKSLGEILLENKVKIEKEKEEKEKLRLLKENQAYKEKYDSIVAFFEKAKQQITDDILSGKDKVSVTTRRTKMQYGEFRIKSGKLKTDNEGNLLRSIWLEIDSKGNLFNDIWYDFVEWIEKNGLKVKIFDCHDGCGMESWVEFEIQNKV